MEIKKIVAILLITLPLMLKADLSKILPNNGTTIAPEVKVLADEFKTLITDKKDACTIGIHYQTTANLFANDNARALPFYRTPDQIKDGVFNTAEAFFIQKGITMHSKYPQLADSIANKAKAEMGEDKFSKREAVAFLRKIGDALVYVGR